MSKIVIDIETVGQDFELLDDLGKEYFLKFAKTDQEILEAKESLSFYPVTAQIVAIGMLEVQSEKAFVYYQNADGKPEKFTEGETVFIAGKEKDILTHFWSQLKNYQQFVTFNGRTFDCPFLMIRSSINGIRPTRNLMPYRYAHSEHVDVSDQLTFYDAMRRKFSLHMWCRAFGIPSPKVDGMTGHEVKNLFKDGRYKDIAKYCLGDIRATKELFKYWDKYIKF